MFWRHQALAGWVGMSYESYLIASASQRRKMRGNLEPKWPRMPCDSGQNVGFHEIIMIRPCRLWDNAAKPFRVKSEAHWWIRVEQTGRYWRLTEKAKFTAMSALSLCRDPYRDKTWLRGGVGRVCLELGALNWEWNWEFKMCLWSFFLSTLVVCLN